jgi:hypothetical protein
MLRRKQLKLKGAGAGFGEPRLDEGAWAAPGY